MFKITRLVKKFRRDKKRKKLEKKIDQFILEVLPVPAPATIIVVETPIILAKFILEVLPAPAPATSTRKAHEKKPSVEERYVAATTVEERNAIAERIVEMRINATGSKRLSWHSIRDALGIKNAEFHQVIRLSDGYREAVVARIASLRSAEGGWEYNGKLEVLTGIEGVE